MMKKKLTIAFSTIVLFLMFNLLSTDVKAQKILSGNLDFLKGTTSLNVVFDYTDFKILKETEAEYVTKEVNAKNSKESGSGDAWNKVWQSDKENRFKEQFILELKEKISIPLDDPNAKYTLIVCNFNMASKGMGMHPAYMNMDYNIVETADSSVSLCKMRITTQSMVKGNKGGMFMPLSTKIALCIRYGAAQLRRNLLKKL